MICQTDISLLLLLSLLAAAQPGEQGLPWTTLPAALAEASASACPVLIYAHADWCAPCHRLEKVTFADATVRERLDRFALTRLDLDDRESEQRVGRYRLSPAEWAARLGADVPPSLVLLASDGAILGRVTGFLEPDALLPILDAALDEPTP